MNDVLPDEAALWERFEDTTRDVFRRYGYRNLRVPIVEPTPLFVRAIGDATGHGIHSAMIAATARGAVEALASFDEKALTPDQVLRAIDQAIRMVGEHNVLMTAFDGPSSVSLPPPLTASELM